MFMFHGLISYKLLLLENRGLFGGVYPDRVLAVFVLLPFLGWLHGSSPKLAKDVEMATVCMLLN
jgi:hypothetical protein